MQTELCTRVKEKAEIAALSMRITVETVPPVFDTGGVEYAKGTSAFCMNRRSL